MPGRDVTEMKEFTKTTTEEVRQLLKKIEQMATYSAAQFPPPPDAAKKAEYMAECAALLRKSVEIGTAESTKELKNAYKDLVEKVGGTSDVTTDTTLTNAENLKR